MCRDAKQDIRLTCLPGLHPLSRGQIGDIRQTEIDHASDADPFVGSHDLTCHIRAFAA